MKFKIRINPVAIADVQEIIEYIAEDSPGVALKIGNNIYSMIEKNWLISLKWERHLVQKSI